MKTVGAIPSSKIPYLNGNVRQTKCPNGVKDTCSANNSPSNGGSCSKSPLNKKKDKEDKGIDDTGATNEDTDEEGTGVDSDSVEGEGQLSLGWSMHGSTTVALMWTLGTVVVTVFM